MKRNTKIKIAYISGYTLFLIVSFVFGFNPGREIGYNFIFFLVYMYICSRYCLVLLY